MNSRHTTPMGWLLRCSFVASTFVCMVAATVSIQIGGLHGWGMAALAMLTFVSGVFALDASYHPPYSDDESTAP